MKKFIILIFVFLITACSKQDLRAPKNLRIENDILYWDEVKNASVYLILINEEEFTSNKNEFDLSFLDNGEYTIKVQAKAKNYQDSNFSETIKYNVELKEPRNLKIVDNTLTWDDIQMASKYTVYINDQTFEVTENSFDLSSLSKNILYEITVVAHYEDKVSSHSKQITYSIFEVPKNLIINEDNILLWDKINEATKYTIYINDKTFEVLENKFDLKQLSENAFYSIKIKAHYNSHQSEFSKEINYHTFKDIIETIQVSFNKITNYDLEVDLPYPLLSIEDFKEENYHFDNSKLTIYNSYLQTLNNGNNSLILYTSSGKILLIINIYENNKPHILSDNKVTYNGEDIIIYFELFGGTISSISKELTENQDYVIDGNKLIIRSDFIKDKDNIIISYTLTNDEYIVLGYIYIS